MGLLPAVWAYRNRFAKGTALMLVSRPFSQRLYQRVWTVYCSFLERSVGNVRHFFWLLFRMT